MVKTVVGLFSVFLAAVVIWTCEYWILGATIPSQPCVCAAQPLHKPDDHASTLKYLACRQNEWMDGLICTVGAPLFHTVNAIQLYNSLSFVKVF